MRQYTVFLTRNKHFVAAFFTASGMDVFNKCFTLWQSGRLNSGWRLEDEAQKKQWRCIFVATWSVLQTQFLLRLSTLFCTEKHNFRGFRVKSSRCGHCSLWLLQLCKFLKRVLIWSVTAYKKYGQTFRADSQIFYGNILCVSCSHPNMTLLM